MAYINRNKKIKEDKKNGRVTLMMTKTQTGMKSSAAGMPLSAAAAANDSRFMMVVAHRITQATLSRGVL